MVRVDSKRSQAKQFLMFIAWANNPSLNHTSQSLLQDLLQAISNVFTGIQCTETVFR